MDTKTTDEIFDRVLIADRRETSAANTAFVAYCRMGPSRSLRKLHAQFEEQAEKFNSGDSEQMPVTTSYKTVTKWSAEWNWVARAEEYDVAIADERLRADAQMRLEERERRRDVLDRMRERVEQMLENVDMKDPKSFRAMIYATDKYMNMSQREWNDLPTERTDVTSGDKPMQFTFVTETIPQEFVTQRLQDLGLYDFAQATSEHDLESYDASMYANLELPE